MMEKDNSLSMAKAAVADAQNSIRLDPSNQQTPGGYSGHNSAPYGSGPQQSAAVPSGSPAPGK